MKTDTWVVTGGLRQHHSEGMEMFDAEKSLLTSLAGHEIGYIEIEYR